MNSFLIQATIIASMDEEGSTFWAQILILVLLGSFWGIYNLVKKKRKEFTDYDEQDSGGYAEVRHRFAPIHKIVELCKDIAPKFTKFTKTEFDGVHVRSFFNNLETAASDEKKSKPLGKNKKDLASGMEILDMDFLLNVVESIEGNDSKDIMMRQLCFDELMRRVRLNCINSQVLKVYAVNPENSYGKDIQCEAMQELAERTTHHVHKEAPEPVLSASG
ncbi:MAG: hypothetical protein ACYSTX_04010 [Planctomycetota bacterium]|jgi:hypothetical protein